MNNKTQKYIINNFNNFERNYNYLKYPADIYNKIKSVFSKRTPTSEQIKDALNWKYGNIEKSGTSKKNKNIIKRVQRHWPKFIKSNTFKNEQDTFYWWLKMLPRVSSQPYITVAFITHLVHHKKNIPIIDQHNYRAMNYLKGNLSLLHSPKKKPSNWQDIIELKCIIEQIAQIIPKKSNDEIDKFLMMLGKSIKPKK